ncbi:MAG: bifunctional ADP-dependent NAD(P)H-hydrate dehydratase/NAD(P)H-hydrate epimerase [Kordia sp.]|nr:MAG: bifunctional ADP-dependent NAD(P)H-hydrate dehydratase/NAD(P)H-hydrate epimerase [Kordia sp.]
MKILSAKQLYQAHDITIKNQEISKLDLLERSGGQVFNWMHTRMQGSQVKIHIFNGIGNNGGVGLVLARYLLEHGYSVANYVVNYSKKRTEGFLKNYEKVKNLKQWPVLLTDIEEFPTDISPDDIIVDAIFGIGLNRDPGTLVNKLFAHLNESKAFKLAIDIPSGLYADKTPDNIENVLFVNFTLSFQSPKMAFFLPETAVFTEQWEVLDIGLDQDFMKTVDGVELISKNEVLPIYKMREKFANKFTYGHSLIIGGSYGKIGAVLLASKAALVSGCGLVTAYVPECGYNSLQSSFPEAMVQTPNDTKQLSEITPEGNFSVAGIGMGMGTSKAVVKALKSFVKTNKLPLVVDADALNIISKNKKLLKKLPKSTILTPHKKELERLIGKWANDFDMLIKVKEFSTENNCIVVVKDAITITVYKDEVFINTSGNPALATAGTGDVLTGIITGFIAQGYEPLQAAKFGVYLHGRTADVAIEEKGYQSFIASDAIANISNAYLDMFKKTEEPKVEEEAKE